MKRKLVQLAAKIVLTTLLGIMGAATLVRFAPGFDVDEQQLDSRLSHESVEAIRGARVQNSNILRFYVGYLRAALHGDFGQSLTLNQPIRTLIAERAPTTLRVTGLGLLFAWFVAACLAISVSLLKSGAYEAAAMSLSGAFLCIPSAVMALAFVMFRLPAQFAIAAIVFPRLFQYIRNVLVQNYEKPHITTAWAKGLGRVRILFFHVLPVSAAPLLSLAGVSVSMALGASVAVEALCGIPGIGQLAWQAALARDLGLLVTLTLLVTLITLIANSVSELATSRVSST